MEPSTEYTGPATVAGANQDVATSAQAAAPAQAAALLHTIKRRKTKRAASKVIVEGWLGRIADGPSDASPSRAAQRQATATGAAHPADAAAVIEDWSPDEDGDIECAASDAAPSPVDSSGSHAFDILSPKGAIAAGAAASRRSSGDRRSSGEGGAAPLGGWRALLRRMSPSIPDAVASGVADTWAKLERRSSPLSAALSAEAEAARAFFKRASFSHTHLRRASPTPAVAPPAAVAATENTPPPADDASHSSAASRGEAPNSAVTNSGAVTSGDAGEHPTQSEASVTSGGDQKAAGEKGEEVGQQQPAEHHHQQQQQQQQSDDPPATEPVTTGAEDTSLTPAAAAHAEPQVRAPPRAALTAGNRQPTNNGGGGRELDPELAELLASAKSALAALAALQAERDAPPPSPQRRRRGLLGRLFSGRDSRSRSPERRRRSSDGTDGRAPAGKAVSSQQPAAVSIAAASSQDMHVEPPSEAPASGAAPADHIPQSAAPGDAGGTSAAAASDEVPQDNSSCPPAEEGPSPVPSVGPQSAATNDQGPSKQQPEEQEQQSAVASVGGSGVQPKGAYVRARRASFERRVAEQAAGSGSPSQRKPAGKGGASRLRVDTASVKDAGGSSDNGSTEAAVTAAAEAPGTPEARSQPLAAGEATAAAEPPAAQTASSPGAAAVPSNTERPQSPAASPSRPIASTSESLPDTTAASDAALSAEAAPCLLRSHTLLLTDDGAAENRSSPRRRSGPLALLIGRRLVWLRRRAGEVGRWRRLSRPVSQASLRTASRAAASTASAGSSSGSSRRDQSELARRVPSRPRLSGTRRIRSASTLTVHRQLADLSSEFASFRKDLADLLSRPAPAWLGPGPGGFGFALAGPSSGPSASARSARGARASPASDEDAGSGDEGLGPEELLRLVEAQIREKYEMLQEWVLGNYVPTNGPSAAASATAAPAAAVPAARAAAAPAAAAPAPSCWPFGSCLGGM